MRVLYSLLGLLFVVGIGYSRWGANGCEAGFQLEAPKISGDWRYATNGDRSTIYLYKDGVQLGGYCYSDGYWRDYNEKTDTWGDKVFCTREDVHKHVGKSKEKKADTVIPVVPVLENGVKNFGVDWNKIENHQFTYEGSNITCDEAKRLIQAEIPDHSKKFHLVAIGTEAQCRTVMDQINTLEPALRSRILTRCVQPGDFSLKDQVSNQVVYKHDGTPSVYFQAPGGKVLHRQDDAVGTVEAVRKAIKQYDQAKDPDLRKPDPVIPVLPALTNPAVIPGLLLGGLFLFAMMRGKTS